MVVPDDARKAMKETNERFCQKVVGEGKFEEIDHVYTVDARILPPGAPLMRGRQAIKQFWQAGIAALGLRGAKLTTLELEMTGDTAVEIGEAELYLGEHGAAIAKYIVHWKQVDGRWLWDKDIWNMN
jgi:ketosteroid isomerase-like protein